MSSLFVCLFQYQTSCLRYRPIVIQAQFILSESRLSFLFVFIQWSVLVPTLISAHDVIVRQKIIPLYEKGIKETQKKPIETTFTSCHWDSRWNLNLSIFAEDLWIWKRVGWTLSYAVSPFLTFLSILLLLFALPAIWDKLEVTMNIASAVTKQD